MEIGEELPHSSSCQSQENFQRVVQIAQVVWVFDNPKIGVSGLPHNVCSSCNNNSNLGVDAENWIQTLSFKYERIWSTFFCKLVYSEIRFGCELLLQCLVYKGDLHIKCSQSNLRIKQKL